LATLTRSVRLMKMRERFNTGARLSLARIASDYGVSVKTAKRDIDELMNMGVALTRNENASPPVWLVLSASRTIDVRYSINDVMALFTARRFFDFLENTSLEDSFARVYSRIESKLQNTNEIDSAAKLAQKVYLIHEGPKKLKSRAAEILDEVLSGLLLERKLDISYRNSRGHRRRITVCPYTLTVFKRGLYLTAAVDNDDGVTRIFALERMTRARWKREQPFAYPPKWNPESFFKNALFIVPGNPEKVVLHFTPTTKPYIQIRKYHESQKLKTLKDGTVEMRLKVPVNFELVNWILSFGQHVNVVSPQKLRTEVAGQLQAALAQYSTEAGKHIDDTAMQKSIRDTLTMDLFQDLEG
jgi:predicted DNA-binding transcriptional regulator YafY